MIDGLLRWCLRNTFLVIIGVAFTVFAAPLHAAQFPGEKRALYRTAIFLDRQDRLSTVSRMKPLQLQQAKQQFSAVAERAAGGQPQIVTKHGKPFVVIVSVADWQKAQPKKRTLLEMLRSCPVDSDELDLTRSKELPRDIEL